MDKKALKAAEQAVMERGHCQCFQDVRIAIQAYEAAREPAGDATGRAAWLRALSERTISAADALEITCAAIALNQISAERDAALAERDAALAELEKATERCVDGPGWEKRDG